jgi:hypothetical protein
MRIGQPATGLCAGRIHKGFFPCKNTAEDDNCGRRVPVLHSRVEPSAWWLDRGIAIFAGRTRRGKCKRWLASLWRIFQELPATALQQGPSRRMASPGLLMAWQSVRPLRQAAPCAGASRSRPFRRRRSQIMSGWQARAQRDQSQRRERPCSLLSHLRQWHRRENGERQGIPPWPSWPP